MRTAEPMLTSETVSGSEPGLTAGGLKTYPSTIPTLAGSKKRHGDVQVETPAVVSHRSAQVSAELVRYYGNPAGAATTTRGLLAYPTMRRAAPPSPPCMSKSSMTSQPLPAAEG